MTSAPATIGVGFDPLKDKILRQSRSTIDGCWFWEGPLSSDGRYGRLNVPRLGEQMAHRVAYRVFVGEIPGGLTLDHLWVFDEIRGDQRC